VAAVKDCPNCDLPSHIGATYTNQARPVFQTLALLRGDGVKSNRVLLYLSASTLRTTDFALVVFTKGEG
jgi:hypothetical protein